MRNKSAHIDSNVVNRLKQGDERAFEFIYDKYYYQIYTFILKTLYDKIYAEDLTQSVFLAIWENKLKIDPQQGIENYIYTIARHQVYRQTERLIVRQRHEEYLKENQPASISFEEDMHSRFLEKILFEWIEELPEKRQEIFLLSRKESLTNREIARQLSISEKTVETQIRRSVVFLKEKMRRYLVGMLFF